MKHLLALTLTLVLVGCNTTPPMPPSHIIEVKEVKVPVYTPPVVPAVPEPELPIKDIDADSSPKVVATKYAETIEVLKAYAKKLVTTIDLYKTPK